MARKRRSVESDPGAADRAKRMKWWHDARFGMFVHWGLYSQLGRHEWVMNHERIPIKEYDPLADSWKPRPHAARQWARLARQAGMKYMVMTTKHHEGFCLWDTQQTDYNAVRRAPGRDLVREYVDACREAGFKIGFYYSLMDWHHPDGARCAKDIKARKRFTDFTRGCVRELMSNYGKIDILWYDVSWPLATPGQWRSRQMNAMVRKLQPHIIINNRSKLDEDFDTPEEHIVSAEQGRAWEACMTFNGSWGYVPYAPEEDWHTARNVVRMLHQVTAGQGNLLLNIGPKPDGSVPEEAVPRLKAVGKWLEQNGEAVYGRVDRAGKPRFEWLSNFGGLWTLKGRTAYLWVTRWPDGYVALGGLKTRLKKASLLASGKPVRFKQEPDRLIFRGLPKRSPDRTVGITVIKMEFASKPRQELGTGCVLL